MPFNELFTGRTFNHGVHPPEAKERTEHLPIQRMPFVARYVLPLSQHIGAPSKPVVRVGERVQRGQLLAEPVGFVSTSLHSPVTGRVTAIAERRHLNGSFVPALEIEADPYSDQRLEPSPPVDLEQLSKSGFIAHVQRGGLVGLGGAAFPAHVKYKLPEGKACQHLVINGCECEPYLTCDHRVMAEQPETVLRGIQIVARHLEADKCTIGVEANKPDAIEALRRAAAGTSVDVVGLEVKYPQGAEKMLIDALFHLKIPAGGLPLDMGMVVNNVGTMAAIADWFDRGQPVIERVVTVSGPGVSRPANLLVPIGTPIRDVLDYCGGLEPERFQVVAGGPMMGAPVASLDAPVLKGTSGLLAFPEAEARMARQYSCVKCGRCLEACPNYLNPSLLGRLGKVGRYDQMLEHYLADCVECGACTYACPSGVPIVQLLRAAKSSIKRRPKT